MLAQVQSKTQAGRVDTALADLAQAPYSLFLAQGVPDKSQVASLLDVGEAVPFLGQVQPSLLELARYVLVAVEQDLGVEGRICAPLDANMCPLRVLDRKGVVLDISQRLLCGNVGGATTATAYIPDQSGQASDQDHKHAPRLRVICQMLLGNLMLAFCGFTVDDRNGMRLSVVRRRRAGDSIFTERLSNMVNTAIMSAVTVGLFLRIPI